ncbi:MAG: hypothetical protein K8F30_00935, partial [Taibaiella sp.]|nr:hypothetical protein [Taibaiella sp.]
DMRFLTCFIIALVPTCVSAQNYFDIYLGSGLASAYAGGPQVRTTAGAIGVNASMKAMLDIHNWQFGAGADIGAMTPGSIERDLTIVTVHNDVETRQAVTREEDAQFAAPYYSPYALINYKLNVTDRLFFYGGGVLGYTFTRQGFDMKPDGANTYFRNVHGMMTGANLGLSINFGGRASLDLSENWRMSFLNEPSPGGYRALEESNRIGAANYVQYFDAASLVTEYKLHVFHTSIAVRISL